STIIVSGVVLEVEGIPDVVVTLTSPSLQGEVVVVTDVHGIFVAQVPSPGTYTIRLEKETYRPYTRTSLELLPGDDRDLAELGLVPEPAPDVLLGCPLGTPQWVDVGDGQARWISPLSSFALVPLSPPFESGGVSRSFDTRLRTFPGLSAGRDGTRN